MVVGLGWSGVEVEVGVAAGREGRGWVCSRFHPCRSIPPPPPPRHRRQVSEGSYDFEANKTLLKLYLLYPSLTNQEKVETVRDGDSRSIVVRAFGLASSPRARTTGPKSPDIFIIHNAHSHPKRPPRSCSRRC